MPVGSNIIERQNRARQCFCKIAAAAHGLGASAAELLALLLINVFDMTPSAAYRHHDRAETAAPLMAVNDALSWPLSLAFFWYCDFSITAAISHLREEVTMAVSTACHRLRA